MKTKTHVLNISGELFQRGFWLYLVFVLDQETGKMTIYLLRFRKESINLEKTARLSFSDQIQGKARNPVGIIRH